MPWTEADDALFDENEKYWRERLKGQGSISNPAPRPLWRRALDNFDELIRHDSPAAQIARRVTPYIPTIERDYQDNRPIEQRRAEVKKRLTQQERDHREVRANYDPADSIGDFIADFIGTAAGSMVSDPTTYIGGVGKNAGEKIINMMGTNALADMAQQGGEMQEGVRDEYDPYQGAFNVALPGVLGTAGHVISRVNAGRKIRAGAKKSNYNDLISTITELEGGGTLANPKTSPKGAKGPMQVMDATARDPGFGIKPWNGKTEADRARVGRQYAAALNDKYDGDVAKVLAAYNGGFARVDAAVKKYGDNWLKAMPAETRKYVRNGTKGEVQGPDDLGEARFFQDDEDFPHRLEMKYLNKYLEPKEDDADSRVADELIKMADDSDDNVVSFTDAWAKQYEQGMYQPLEPLDSSHEKFTPYVEKPSDPANDTVKLPKDYTDEEWHALTDNQKQAAWNFFEEHQKTMYSDGTPKLKSVLDFQKETGKQISYKTQQIAHDFAKEIEVDPDLLMQQYIFSSNGSLAYIKNQLKKDWESYKQEVADIDAKVGSTPFKQEPFEPKSEAGKDYAKKVYGVGKDYGDDGEAYKYKTTPEEDDDFYGDDFPKLEDSIDYDDMNDYDHWSIKPHYDYIGAKNPFEEFKEKKGVPVDTDWELAIQDVAYAHKVHPYDVAEALFNKDPVKGLDVEKISTEVENKAVNYYASKNNLSSPEPSLSKAKTKGPPSKFEKAGEIFLDMLKDESGRATVDPQVLPKRVHEAVTAWDKGTHVLVRGKDGTPMRLYHGTPTPYEGLPSGEHNVQPPGFVLYSTDPNFASSYARFYDDPSYGGRASRVYPVYLKKGQKIGDFRNPEDLAKAKAWYEKKYGKELYSSTFQDLKSGNWTVWEKPEMLKDLGWQGAYMTENGSLNLMIKDHLVSSIFDPATYRNNTIGHKIVRTLRDLIKDESGSYRGEGFGEGRGPDIDPVEAKLRDAIKSAIPVSAEQRKLYRQARAEKAGQVDKLQQEGLGEVGYYAQLKALKGALPKADFESLRDNFSQEEINHLLNKINFNNSLMPLEKVKAQTAMAKLLGLEGANFSKVPTAGEIKLLQEVYSKDLIKTLLDNRTLMEKAMHGFMSGLNVPRALMASMDVSAPFRQGINFIGKKEFWKAIPTMLKVFGSEANSKALMDEIRSRPTWELMKKAKLGITDPHSHFLADREEAFMTDYAEGKVAKAMLVGYGVEASNRAYSGFLNKLRADVFDDLVSKYEKAGINLATDPKKLKEVARFINAATGRGDMGKAGNAAAPWLSNIFFSPRLMASRLYMLSPHIYAKTDPILRKEAWKSLFSFASAAVTVGGLAHYALGMDVETDPTSADFMKPKIGNTRYDIMGGYQQYIRLAAQIITNETMTAKGEKKELTGNEEYKANTKWDVAENFVENKFSPIMSFFKEWMDGKDAVGEPFDMDKAVVSRLIPLGAQDMADAYKEWGAVGIPMAAPSLTGIGVQTYQPKPPKEKKSKKKDDFDTIADVTKDFEDDESFNVSEWDF